MTTSTPAPLTPAEVAALFWVDPKTVTSWARDGKLPSFRTPGGHRRYPSKEVYALRTANFTAAQG
nr:BldC family transcriptional regulator [Nocardiopsis quinghaiensis]